MELAVDTLDNGVKKVALIGRLDLDGVNEIEEAFVQALSGKGDAIVLDLTNLEFLASIGMRLFIMHARNLKASGGKVVLFNPKAFVYESLRAGGIDKLLTIYEDFDDAVADVASTV